MAMPKVLDWLDELVAKVATNTTNIAQNAKDIEETKTTLSEHMLNDDRHWTMEDRDNFNRTIHFKGYFVSLEKLKEAYPTGQLGDYAIVGGSDTVWLWDDETNAWINSTEQGVVISVNGRTGEVILTKTDVGLSNVDNTSDIDKPISTAQQAALDAKADRKKITLAEAESLSLRAGIYYIDNEKKTINDFSSNYWTVIVAERAVSNSASATQIWMNYNSNVTQHMYIRKQQSGTSWSEFREILTDIHFSQLNTKIQTNIDDIAELQVNKANRGIITLAQANSIDELKSGIYSVENYNEGIEISGVTSKCWTVIYGDWSNGGAVQIWIPFDSEVQGMMLWRHQKMDEDTQTRIWGDFYQAGTTKDVEELQAQITENKNNISENSSKIEENITSINTLKEDRAERKVITLSEANGFSLRSGIYYINDESVTINQTKSQFWTVIVGEGDLEKSTSQIWIPTVSQIPVSMFLRHQVNVSTSWTDFVEILTTNIATREDINRFKQYKGYYALLPDLKDAFPTAIDGDYAIVGNTLYIWNSKTDSWDEISGDGGSGKGKWSIRQYNAPDYTTEIIPDMKYLVGKILEKQWEDEDSKENLLNSTELEKKYFLFETYVNMKEDTSISTTTLSHDNGVCIYVNREIIYSTKDTSSSTSNRDLTLDLKQGWNKIQVILGEDTGGELFCLGIKFTENENCLSMDCYHAETEPVLGYVSLVGDSVIEGNITTTKNLQANGTVNITSNSYLQYNEEDDSLSFMFNN